jgi:putative membrane protein insertion efficiency factor
VNPLQYILIFTVRVYRLVLSPAQAFLFGPTGGCRFTPTCSVYAMDAVREHGAVAGSVLAAGRICRCHPWGGCGHDPVPPKKIFKKPSEKPATVRASECGV